MIHAYHLGVVERCNRLGGVFFIAKVQRDIVE